MTIQQSCVSCIQRSSPLIEGLELVPKNGITKINPKTSVFMALIVPFNQDKQAKVRIRIRVTRGTITSELSLSLALEYQLEVPIFLTKSASFIQKIVPAP